MNITSGPGPVGPVCRAEGRAVGFALMAGLTVLVVILLAGVETASAQTLVRRCNGLFDCLFTDHRPSPRVQQAPRRGNAPAQSRRPWRSPEAGRRSQRAAPSNPPTRTSHPRRTAPRSRPVEAPPEPPAPEKLDDARVVLVVGDFLAGGLADGLEEAYAGSPGVRVVDRSNGSSGLVRDDYYDWNGEISEILEETKPAAVVVMMGSNDRQQLVVDGAKESPRSEAWVGEYEHRVKQFAEAIRSRDLPLVWTGLPAFKSPSMTSDMLAFNDIYKNAAEAAGGEFVDIWDGFVDENGNFVFDGPDINGQTVRLRGSDGINMTKAARRKVAYYVEKPLSNILGDAVSPDIGAKEIDGLPDAGSTPGKPADLDRTAPISLLDPDLDGGSQLMGGDAVAATGESMTAARKLVVQGIAPAARTGRADDFGLGEETPSVTLPHRPEAGTGALPDRAAAPAAADPGSTGAVIAR